MPLSRAYWNATPSDKWDEVVRRSCHRMVKAPYDERAEAAHTRKDHASAASENQVRLAAAPLIDADRPHAGAEVRTKRTHRTDDVRSESHGTPCKRGLTVVAFF